MSGALDRNPLLVVEGLRTTFPTRAGLVEAVDDVSLTVHAGECLGVVGESGSGKSVTFLSVLGLIRPPGRVEARMLRFDGVDLLSLDEGQRRAIRGRDIAITMQDALTALNPGFTVATQITEVMLAHGRARSTDEARSKAIDMLRLVGIPAAAARLDDYPHQFSGGMRQRIMIATALACRPRLLIADEPTTALDVTIQAQILELMLELKEQVGAAIVLITHDLGVVAETAQRVVVMYAGRKVEEATVADLFARPMHPYTRGLMGSIPRLAGGAKRLTEIPGIVPRLNQPIIGCAFAERCAFVKERCRKEAPVFEAKAPAHFAACFESANLP
ncbi:MAG: ABC transporter ATP-binding protein [Alphaproteobacteria bacterium]|nr:ABC transporter ATP-binding protein [Alphaproteobacteria bacterium]